MMPSIIELSNSSPVGTRGKKPHSNGMSDEDEERIAKAAYLCVIQSLDTPISSADQLSLALQFSGRNVSRKMVEKWWNPSKGSISFYEFVEILSKEPESAEDDLRRSFAKMDLNKDGWISFRELKTMLQKRGEKLSEQEIQDIFQDFDQDGDGHIDYNEFVRTVLKTAKETKEVALRKLERRERREKRAREKEKRSKKHQNGEHHRSSSSHRVERRRSSELSHTSVMGGALNYPAPEESFKKGPHSRKLDWNSRKSKGCFFLSEEGAIIGHQYGLKLSQPDLVWISIEPSITNDTPSTSSSRLPDINFALIDSGRKKVAVMSLDRSPEGASHAKINLEPGSYAIIPLTSGLFLKPRTHSSSTKKASLLEENSTHLTKAFKMTLMNVFDLFDLDDSGTLNRDEFFSYNVLTGDDDVTDEEWETLKENMDTKHGELTLKGFIQLHEMEAEDNEGDTSDMWLSLTAIGYNHSLQLDQALPFVVTVFSEERLVELKVTGISKVFSGQHWDLVLNHVLDSGLPIAGQTIKALGSPFWLLAVLTYEGSGKRKGIEVGTSENTLFDKENHHLNRTAAWFLPQDLRKPWKLSLETV